VSGRLGEAGKRPSSDHLLTNSAQHELDRILDVLERMNVHDERAIPSWLADRLLGFGIVVGCRSVTEVIESVFDAQAAFMPVFVVPRKSSWLLRNAQLVASGRVVVEGHAVIRLPRPQAGRTPRPGARSSRAPRTDCARTLRRQGRQTLAAWPAGQRPIPAPLIGAGPLAILPIPTPRPLPGSLPLPVAGLGLRFLDWLVILPLRIWDPDTSAIGKLEFMEMCPVPSRKRIVNCSTKVGE
jgi:hypothetical protein